jgi:hypothetical protein
MVVVTASLADLADDATRQEQLPAPDQSDDAAAGRRGLGNGSRPLVARSVATEELGSSVSFKQVLRMVGSSRRLLN